MKSLSLMLGGLLLISSLGFIYQQAQQEPPAITITSNASAQRPSAETKIKTQPQTEHRQSAGTNNSEDFVSSFTAMPQPADFIHFDGEELVLTLSGLKQLNEAGRIDSFAKALRAEQRSDTSLDAERQLTELLQHKVQVFRQSALSRIDCGEYFCLVVAPVQQPDELFNEFLQHSKTLGFGSGSFYNFQSNGELYNSLILSLKANTSIQ